uniref:non-specific serine/threonine protein kinase n=1 Tax=Davidia involucrata TaxID=16924 RepID=A0A5B7B4G6_DAVIN
MSRSRIWSFVFVSFVWLYWSSLHIGAVGQITHPAEVTALRSIKNILIDPNQNLSNWNRGDPCTSNWTGVLCFNMSMDDGYFHVRELQLLNMNLSGSLSPQLGRLSYMKILDVMWNKISGSIPKEIGNITSLELLLLNGNQLTGPLPEEIGYLPNLDRIQIDQNQISGPIPKSFVNLNKTKHFHMNNNSISGQIPPELSTLPNLVHLLLDNNNLSGYLPPELAEMPSLLILQLDNNHFDGSTIPASYGNMSHLLKLSLRNCSLQGPIPDLSRIPHLAYIDLSSNQLNGSIPPNKLSEYITTIDLSTNNLTGIIPVNFSGLPRLQRLSLANNSLYGSVPSTIWQNRTFNETERLVLELQNNMLSNISGSLNLPSNVTIRLQGNPICLNANSIQFCGSQNENVGNIQNSTNSTVICRAQSCPPPYEYSPASTSVQCFCAAPLLVWYRLKSPGFSDFLPYIYQFEVYLTSGLNLNLYQLDIDLFIWQKGPRLKLYLKIFPVYIDNGLHVFNRTEVIRIRSMFTGWTIPDSEVFGPYELLNFTLLDPYKDVVPSPSTSGISKGVLVGIVLGAIAGAVTLSAIVSLLILRLHTRKHHAASKRRLLSKIKIDGVKSFTYGEMALATNNFNSSTEVGQGGYGKVYRGILADGTVVAIKRAQEGSLQGEKEFLTEIELLSRVHHRNLVSLFGYCDEEGEQMLVYEFISNGTLRDHLSGKSKKPLNFAMRLRIALASAKGILYLHTEANPPIFHRDIKASNILLDSKFTAKVADFGLSRLAPVPDIEGIVPAHVSTVVKGTPGYLDPEYFLTHKLTDKSDVYSLGVVFLELLTGMQPISRGKNIVREVNIAYQSGMIFSVIDGGMGSYPSDCVEKFMTLALKSCQEETDARPSMSEVVRELESISLMMPESDTKATESLITNPGKVATPPSSSSTIKSPYVSTDVSGSDLVSGVIPSITPR